MADEIKALIEAMHTEQYAAMTSKDETQVDKFFDKFYATDMVFIRPSGNPMDIRSARGMWLGDDVKTEAQNDDIAKYSMTFEKVGDKWTIVQAHRASGQPPAAA